MKRNTFLAFSPRAYERLDCLGVLACDFQPPVLGERVPEGERGLVRKVLQLIRLSQLLGDVHVGNSIRD